MPLLEPDPMAACCPGGTCTTCNCKATLCAACGEAEVDEAGQRCEACTDDTHETKGGE